MPLAADLMYWRSPMHRGHRCAGNQPGTPSVFVCLPMKTLSFNEISAIRNPLGLCKGLSSLSIFLFDYFGLNQHLNCRCYVGNSQLTVN